MWFISDAAAAAGGQAAAPNPMSSIIMLVIFGLVFYFLIIRPQSKRAKAHQQVVESLKVGDEVMTQGGIVGKVRHLDDQYVRIKIAKDTQVVVQRRAVMSSLPNGTLKSLLEDSKDSA